MARFYECGACEHAQLVGVIDNGLSGYADPDARCENCGAVGEFYFGPGAARQMREQIAHLVTEELPDTDVITWLDRFANEADDIVPTRADSSIPSSPSTSGLRPARSEGRASVATTVRVRRTQQEWEAMAREILPGLQEGRPLSDYEDRYGSGHERIRVELARLGFDSRGRPIRLRPIQARGAAQAKAIAKRRREGSPWWLLTAESGLSYQELRRLLREHGFEHLTVGRPPAEG